MDTLFGVPTQQLMWALLAVFGLGALVLGVSALRNRVAFKMAVRNIPRRKTQSVLIVAGLMLATLLFSASFTTGDTLTNSIRTQALEGVGQVDVVVEAGAGASASDNPFMQGPATRVAYFDEGVADDARDSLADEERVAGAAPLASETVPVTAASSGLSEPRVDVLGIDEGSMKGFDRLTTASGETLPVDDLSGNEVYVSAGTAEGLDVGVGDGIEVFLGPHPAKLEVAGVYASGAYPASATSAVMPLGELQDLTGTRGAINKVIVTHEGPAVEGAAGTSATLAALKPVLVENDLKADPVKRDTLEQADEVGSQFSRIFLLMGQFSIAAGILLIFLIFVMLAAERKRELGIARGVGMQRGQLMRSFAFEGAVYALIASAAGSVLGVGVGWAMVRVIGRAFARVDFEIAFAFSPENVVIAFAMGMVLTFAVVVLSSWRVSRLNIVRAIRDIPEPDRRGRTVKGVLLAVVMPLAGVLLAWQGLGAEQASLYMSGLSLVIVGAALLARVLGLPDRAAFTLAGLGLLGLWLSPVDFAPEGMSRGIEMFFVSGLAIVVGAVWVVVYNSDLLLGAIVAVFGRVRGLPPVLKTAVSYPMQSRFRTGMTLAMFSLVVFTIVTMSFVSTAFGGIFENTDRLSGGFDVRADAGYFAPVSDMEAALKDAKGVNEDDITAVGAISGLPTEAKQRGTDRKPKDLYVQGVDEGYAGSTVYGFNTTAAGYASDREVWMALVEEPDTAVISADLAPAKSSFALGGEEPTIKLTGFYQEDEALPDDLYVRVEDPNSGEVRDLRVIGVLDDTAFYAGQVMTSRKTLDSLAGAPVPAQSYVFALDEGAGAAATARSLEEAFVENGLQTTVLEEEIRDSESTNSIMNDLLTGFMGLGLLVGICALGVIAARSVVERRQQIGVMRALGFQRGQVRLAFLLESSFIALLGIGIGVALGAALSGGLIDAMSADFAGISYAVPWTTLALIVVASYAASLLTTFLPARGASKVYPAEALRYE